VVVVSLTPAAVISGEGAQAPRSAAKATAKPWTAPRTPWGDPDLQGNYTNVYEDGTPLERPEQFAGRKLDEIKGEELAALKRATQQRTISNFEGPIHAPDHWWQDALFLEKGSQAWFVTDPPDGKIPTLTPDAQRRIDTARGARAASGRGPADSYEDRSLYDRCITRGLPGSMMPAIYGDSYRIVQGQGFVGILYEMIHEARVIPLEAQPRPPGHGRRAWPLGGRYPGGRNDQLPSPERVPERERGHVAVDRTLHADLARQGQVVGDRRRSVDMDQTVDVLDAVDGQ
jgi:hypothetical protein